MQSGNFSFSTRIQHLVETNILRLDIHLPIHSPTHPFGLVFWILEDSLMKRNVVRLMTIVAVACASLLVFESQANATLFGGSHGGNGCHGSRGSHGSFGGLGGRLGGGHRWGKDCCESSCEEAPKCEEAAPCCKCECKCECPEPTCEKCCDSDCGDKHCGRKHRNRCGRLGRHNDCGCESGCNGGEAVESAPAESAAPAEEAAPAAPPAT
jgi:hypothetical protein